MSIETLRSLAWTARPVPPLGVVPWNRQRQWFRWYITYRIERLFYQFRLWRWMKRTGGLQVWL